MGLGGPKTVDAAQNATAATLAFAGSNRDIVANRRAIRMANMSAAEVLKAELGGLPSPTPSSNAADPMAKDPILSVTSEVVEEDEIPGLGGDSFMDVSMEAETLVGTAEIEISAAAESFLSGVKRKLEEAEDSDSTPLIPDEDEEPGKGPLALKVNPDGTVEQEDTVKSAPTFLAPSINPDILGIDSGSLVTVNGITSKNSVSHTPTRSSGKGTCA
jgi:5'-3' exoribonuclease 2